MKHPTCIIETTVADDPRVAEALDDLQLENPVADGDGTAAWLALDSAGRALGAAVVRKQERHWRLRRMRSVEPRRGVGTQLLRAIQEAAANAGIPALSVGTYARWTGMRAMLQKEGWAPTEAKPGSHQDGVEEQWILPLPRKPLEVVIVGANPQGRGGELIEAIQALTYIRLVGICDTSQDVLTYWRADARCHDVRCSGELAQLLDDTLPDAAILALPHRAYRQQREVLLNRPIGFLQEKPLACDLKEVLELQRGLQRASVPLVVGVQRRAHPSYLYLKEKLDRNNLHSVCIRLALGRDRAKDMAAAGDAGNRAACAAALQAESAPQHDWRQDPYTAGGGVLIDLGYHAIDLAHFLLDAPLDVLSCNLWTDDRPTSDREIDDAVTLIGRCGRTWVRIEASRYGGRKEEWVVAEGPSERWEANRSSVRHNGEEVYACDGNWDLAVRGLLAELAIACAPDQPRRQAPDLWDHLAQLHVIEQARFAAVLAGLTHHAPAPPSLDRTSERSAHHREAMP